jgi:N-acetylglucosamine-6-phosphate deacetylase
MGDGSFRLGTFEVEVKGERCLAGGKLAGSVLTMDRAVQNVLKFGKWNLQDTIRLATLNPAKVIGVDDRKGSLAPGKDADIVVLNPTGEVLSTLLGGSPL